MTVPGNETPAPDIVTAASQPEVNADGPVDSGPDRSGKRMQRNAMWRMGAFIFLQVIRLISQPILANLLGAATFGVVTLANIVVQALNMFSEVGIRHSIVRDERGGEPEFLDTAWTLQVMRGVILFGMTLLIAWPYAAFYDAPQLMYLVPAVGLGALMAGFNSTRFDEANRNLNERGRSILEFTRSVVARAAMLIWAYFAPSAWALVGGSLVGAFVFLVLTHTVLSGHRNRFRWDRDAISRIVSFGIWILIGSMIAFFGQRADALILGKLEILTILGVYTVATTVARIPRDLVMTIGQHVLYPLIAAERAAERVGASDDFRARFIRLRGVVMEFGLVALLGMGVTVPWFFHFFFNLEFQDGQWVAQLTMVSVWFAIINNSCNQALLAIGQPGWLAFSGGLRVFFGVAGGFAGYAIGGIPGFILGLPLGQLIEHVSDTVVLRRNSIRVTVQDARFTGIGLLVFGVFIAIDRYLMGGSGVFGMSTDASRIVLSGVTSVLLVTWFLVRTLRKIRSV